MGSLPDKRHNLFGVVLLMYMDYLAEIFLVCRVARLLLVMPATNATSERCFSVMRRLKNYMWSTMTQTRLNHIMILAIYREQLDLSSIVNQFVAGSKHRLHVFSSF